MVYFLAAVLAEGKALLCRDEFDPAARVELFGELAAHFHAKTEFPPEATDGVADEQFLRNVVDVLYRGSNSDSHRTSRSVSG